VLYLHQFPTSFCDLSKTAFTAAFAQLRPPEALMKHGHMHMQHACLPQESPSRHQA